MIQLAGGQYVFDQLGDDKATSSINLEMEQFYATAKDADFIIYNSTIGGNLTSIDHFLSMNPLLKDFTEARLYPRRTSELTVETSCANIIFKVGMEC